MNRLDTVNFRSYPDSSPLVTTIAVASHVKFMYSTIKKIGVSTPSILLHISLLPATTLEFSKTVQLLAQKHVPSDFRVSLTFLRSEVDNE